MKHLVPLCYGRWTTLLQTLPAIKELLRDIRRQSNNHHRNLRCFLLMLWILMVEKFGQLASMLWLISSTMLLKLVRGSIKPIQKNFNHLHNDQALTLDVASIIQPFLDDNDSITSQTFNYRPISEIESLENNNIMDVIGVVTSIRPTTSIMTKKWH
ncbi:hypothetical protein JHK82_055657 [Glycine max]|nr:hypothetical protein JHK82_055657 [Glycine max]